MKDEQAQVAYTYWEGPTRIRVGQTTHDVSCRVVLPSADADLQIRVENEPLSISVQALMGEVIEVEVPLTREVIQVFPSSSTLTSEGERQVTFTFSRSPIWFTKAEDLSLGRALLVNLPLYWISGRGYTRFELKACGWVAQLIPIYKQSLAVAATIQSDQYRITYQLEFGREDNASFKAVEAQRFIDELRIFLSFCRGEWVGVSFTVGCDEKGEAVLEQWGTGKVSSWSESSNWLDKLSGSAIELLYRPFFEKLSDESWKQTLNHVVYWSNRSETSAVGPDGGCVLLQVVLERFAWQLLVIERKTISKVAFEKLEAADQLRLMLSTLSIPAEVPGGLSELSAFAKLKGLDGPAVFTRIRNRIVHPPKSTTREKFPYYQAYLLGKWYVDLAVLSVCRYNGEYSNRTAAVRWVGQVEKVPWA